MSNAELSSPPVPLLVDGDRLTRDEFERRYHAMPDLKKAELIEGVVRMPSPVSLSSHGIPHTVVCHWAAAYWLATPGTQAATDTTVRLDMNNTPQPDVALFILPSHGGQARVSADDYIEDAPELVVEVAASSASFDLNTKLRVYQRNGVREYIVWRMERQQVDWFVLRDGKYDRLAPTPTGLLCSKTFPGLWLDSIALARGDFVRVMMVLQQGIQDPTHAAFVAALQRRAGTTP